MKTFLDYIFLFPLVFIFITCVKSKEPIAVNDSVGIPIALTNGILVDGTGSQPKPNTTIIIRNEHIKSVDTDSNFTIPDGARIIDLHGAYILPGLMNTHVHGGYIENNLRVWAKSGVTTVRDLGNLTHSPSDAFSIRDALLDDNRNSRLVCSGPLVTTVGGYGNYPIASTTDAENKINELIYMGADLIKVAIEDDLQGRTWPMLSMDEIEAIVQTAHNRNKRVSAHISRTKHLYMAIKAGVDDVAHMVIDYLPDSLITLMIERDIYWVPTLELWKGVSQLHNLSWDIMAKNNLHRFIQAGGKVALGTDYDGYVTPFDLGMPMHEMQLMQEAGMTAMQIIIAGTQNAALVCNLENKLGTIEPDKIADLIIVKNSPLDDLESLLNLQMVIHNGEIIKL
jgi:imidazolonepropionase-like amidohydrolase